MFGKAEAAGNGRFAVKGDVYTGRAHAAMKGRGGNEHKKRI